MRHLKHEEASLLALKDEVRHDRAITLLQRTDRAIERVAEAAGFQIEKSFIWALIGGMRVTPGSGGDRA